MVTESRFSWDCTDSFCSPVERLCVQDLDEWDFEMTSPDQTGNERSRGKRRRRIDQSHDGPQAPQETRVKNSLGDEHGQKDKRAHHD